MRKTRCESRRVSYPQRAAVMNARFLQVIECRLGTRYRQDPLVGHKGGLHHAGSACGEPVQNRGHALGTVMPLTAGGSSTPSSAGKLGPRLQHRSQALRARCDRLAERPPDCPAEDLREPLDPSAHADRDSRARPR